MNTRKTKLQVTHKANEQTRFKKGVSGNPAGRPKRNNAETDLRNQILAGSSDLIAHLFKQAYLGDIPAAKLLLERVLPPIKSQLPPVEIHIPEGDIASQVNYLFQAASQGHICVESATELVRIAQIALSLADSTSIDLPSEEDPEIENATSCSHATHPPDPIPARSVTVTEMAQHPSKQTPLEKMNPTPVKENLS